MAKEQINEIKISKRNQGELQRLHEVAQQARLQINAAITAIVAQTIDEGDEGEWGIDLTFSTLTRKPKPVKTEGSIPDAPPPDGPEE